MNTTRLNEVRAIFFFSFEFIFRRINMIIIVYRLNLHLNLALHLNCGSNGSACNHEV